MIEILTLMNNVMEEMNVPYTFDNWDEDVELPQFIGEVSEVPTTDEDGKSEYSFILNGYSTKYDDLFVFNEQLKNRFRLSAIINGVVIKYDNMITVDSGSEDLKQIQINFTVKKWSV